MSYTITLWCGCTVYVACHPLTGIAHHRVIERRGDRCTERKHARGLQLRLWELLPDSRVDETHVTYEPYDVNG